MSTPESPLGQAKYYDPAEVEAYVNDVTTTIKALQARLQEAARRADEAEQVLAERNPETASLGRALLLAGEVADKAIADADARAAAIVRAAEDRAAGIVESAQAEARRLVEAARGAAAENFQVGEARLLAAVSAFVEGTNVLRSELTKIEADARGRQFSSHPRPPEPSASNSFPPASGAAGAGPDRSWHPSDPSPQASRSSPMATRTPEGSPSSGPEAPPDPPGGIRNRAPWDDRTTSFFPLQPPMSGAPDARRGGNGA